MIGAAELGSMHKNWTNREKSQQSPAIPETHPAHPPPEKPSTNESKQRRDQRTGQIQCMGGERFQQDRQAENEIIKGRGCMGRCALRKIFELVMTNNQTRMLCAHPHTRHARVAIGISKISVPPNKNVLIIRAARGENEGAQDYNLNRNRCGVRNTLKRNLQSLNCDLRLLEWARQDSNLGPRDYESPALPLSYRPNLAHELKHSLSPISKRNYGFDDALLL